MGRARERSGRALRRAGGHQRRLGGRDAGSSRLRRERALRRAHRGRPRRRQPPRRDRRAPRPTRGRALPGRTGRADRRDLWTRGTRSPATSAFGADTLHDTRSISKSVVGLLVGIAQHGRRDAEPGTSVLSLFPELADLRTPERDAITLEQLLSMSSGLAWDEWNAGPLTSDETRLFWKAEPVRFVFDRPLAAKPGTQYNYNGGGTATLAELLTRERRQAPRRAGPRGAVRAARHHPLGVGSRFSRSPARVRRAASAPARHGEARPTRARRRTLARSSAGARSVGGGLPAPADRHRAADAARRQRRARLRLPVVDREHELAGSSVVWSAALGNGGQRIFVVPALDLTVVTTAGDYGSREIGPVVGDLFARIVATVAE